MPEDNPIRIFVTHTFSDNSDYIRVFEYLESVSNFFYKNCSDPDQRPASGNKEALKEELRRQLTAAEIVLLPAGMYPEQRDWLMYQMVAAKANGIPLVALELFGGVGNVHADITARAVATVAWNEREIVDAVRQYARGEATTRFETIEFELP